jgi:hypothetical protein
MNFAYFSFAVLKIPAVAADGELNVEIAMQVEDEIGKVVLPVRLCWTASSRPALLALACIVMLALEAWPPQ